MLCIVAAIAIAMGGALYLDKAPSLSAERINEAKSFAKANGFNLDYCIFVDYSMPSRSKRMMVYDISQDKVVYSCKCAHGNGGGTEATLESFSNEPNSHKTSLGRYRIGKKRIINSIDGQFDVSMFGIPCYELHGLDETNSNAYKRGILLHPSPIMTTLPVAIPPWHSLGCFSIPNSAFNTISKYIDQSKNPMLLWAYYDSVSS